MTSSSSPTPTPPSPLTKLPLSSIADATAQTTDLSCAFNTPTKNRRRRRKRRKREEKSSIINDEVLSPVKVTTNAPSTITTISDNKKEYEDDVVDSIRGKEGFHSSMPPFAVRHNIIDTSNGRKNRRRRRRRPKRTSVSASVLVASSSSSSSTSSSLTSTSETTYTKNSSTRIEATVDKYINLDKEENAAIVTPKMIATVVETNKISSSQKRQRTKTSRTGGGDAIGGGKDGECLRRIKREWKDAVKMGIGYDWMNMRTIDNQRRSSTSNKNHDHNDSSSQNNYIRIGPYGKNLLRWHFSVAGPVNSVYAHGIYHGAILLPRDYPASPPRVRLLTPSGRFIVDADICLTASSYHPESWTPRWTVVSLVQALRVHMLTSPAEIGGMHASEEKRREFAVASREWRSRDGIVNHGRMVEMCVFPPPPVHAIDGLVVPTVEIGINNNNNNKSHDDTSLCTIDDNGEDDKQEQQHEEEDAIFTSFTLRRSASSSLDTSASDEITCTSTTTVQLSTKSSSIQHVQCDRHIQSHEIVRSKAGKNATTTITKTKSSKGEKASNKKRGILAIALKRIFLEVLKLPFRMLSILLKIIGELLAHV